VIANFSYYYFTGALSHKFCDEVIKYALQKKEIKAVTGAFGRKRDIQTNPLTKNEEKKLHKKRKSDVVWLDERWIYKEIQPYVDLANAEAKWNFDWDWSEPIQFTKYKLNEYYDWHCDSFAIPNDDKSNKNTFGKIRKLSVTCQLDDNTKYEGGELEFQPRNEENPTKVLQCKEILPRGSVVVFPSYVWHRVKPVKKGTRYSLVLWNLGYPFK
jgi:PKHD-type hydroxylase